jgi:hypothetical protein
MRVKKINFLYIVKYDIAKNKIQKILGEKNLTEYDIQFIYIYIYINIVIIIVLATR